MRHRIRAEEGVVVRSQIGEDQRLVPLLLLTAGAIAFNLFFNIHSVFRYSSTSKGTVCSSFLKYSG